MPSLRRPLRPLLLLCLLPVGMGIARAVPVTLRVTDSANKPVAGATVQYIETPADVPNDEYVLPKTPVPHTATAGDDGVVTLDLPDVILNDADKKRMELLAARTKKDADLTPRLAFARVRKPGLASEDVPLHAGENSVNLKPGAQMSGLVSDDKGAPLAGAQVKLLRVTDKANSQAQYYYYNLSGLDALAAKTGADGRWVLDELPQNGVASLQASAPRRVSTGFRAWLEGAQNPAPTQKLDAGGTISGRLLDQKGEPIAGAGFYLGNGYDGINRTDKDGRFRLEGVALGTQQLQVFGGPNWYGHDEPITATIKAGGQNVDLGDLTSGAGTLVSGVVLDKTSRKPLAGVEVRLENKKIKTDAQGHFEGRISGNYLQLEIGGDYVTSNDRFRQIPAKTATYDAGQIIVERAASLPLDVRDEKGDVVSEMAVLFTDNKGSQGYAQFDGESQKVGPLAAGEYQVKGYGSWEVIEPKTAKIPAFVEGEKPKPLTVKMRRTPQQKITGRVVDVKGAPLANVTVGVKLSGEQFRFQPLTALSKRDGTWELEFAPTSSDNGRKQNTPTEPSIGDIKSANFARLRGGEVTRQNDNWSAADIVMARSDATLQGRVVNADGTPINNVSLSWTGAKTGEFARTNADGHFTLTGLPDAPLQLRVSDGPRLLETRELTPGEITDIVLPAAETAGANIETLWQQESAGGIADLDAYYEALGAPRLLEAALRADAAKAKPEDKDKIGPNLDAYLQMLVNHQPDKAVAQGVELVKDKNLKGANGSGVAALALAAARSDDEGARAWANRWFDTQKANFSMQQEGNDAVVSALKLAAVGTRLGRGEAASYRQLALVWSDRVKDDSRAYSLDDWGALLWAGGPQFYDDAVSDWPALDRLLALSGALKRIESAEQGRALLARLETLAKDPEVAKADAARAEKQPYSESMRDRALQSGRANFARALAKIDPSAALDEMEKVTESFGVQDVAVQIASDAIANKQPELARRALKFGLKDNYTNRPGTSAMAMLARGFDVKLADELLAATRDEVLPKEENRFGGDFQSVSNYAVALRDVEPGTGRLLLEAEWARRDAQKPDPNNRWERENALRELARAMAVYDVARALQWAQKIDDGNGDTSLRTSVVAAALATPDARPFMLVRHYGG